MPRKERGRGINEKGVSEGRGNCTFLRRDQDLTRLRGLKTTYSYKEELKRKDEG